MLASDHVPVVFEPLLRLLGLMFVLLGYLYLARYRKVVRSFLSNFQHNIFIILQNSLARSEKGRREPNSRYRNKRNHWTCRRQSLISRRRCTRNHIAKHCRRTLGGALVLRDRVENKIADSIVPKARAEQARKETMETYQCGFRGLWCQGQ